MTILDQLMHNTLFCSFVAACTIGPIILGLGKLIIRKKEMEFTYAKASSTIIQNGKGTIPNLSISYNGQAIEDLSITKIPVWNSGKKVIYHDNIVLEQPLRVEAQDEKTTILNASIVFLNEESNKAKIDYSKISSKVVPIDFDYVAPKEGFVIQVLHSGPRESIIMDCKIKGGEKIRSLSKKKRSVIKSNKIKKRLSVIMLVSLCCVYTAIMALQVIDAFRTPSPTAIRWFVVLASIAVILGMTLMTASLIRDLYHLNIPSSMRESIDNVEYEN